MQKLTSTEGQSDLPRYFRRAFAVIASLDYGQIEIGLPDGRVFVAKGDKPGPVGRFDVQNPDLFARLVRDGDMGFTDAYVEGGWWTSPDLQAFLDVIIANNDQVARGFPGRKLLAAYERLRHWLRSNSKFRARKNISYHYDLGNDFYKLWLDPTMSYSSALYETGQEDLERAQTQKYAAMCKKLGVKEGDHILEIGCGWGGFAEFAAKEYGARVTGLTISQEQHDYAVERIKQAGLADKVDIVMRDYRDETGTYDHIASIEMFEAVGEKYWPVYFETVRERLKPGGNACLQIITVADRLFEDYRKTVDFIQKHIFPGGMLPSPTALKDEIRKAGLDFKDSMEFGKSYSLTLRRWYDTFNEKWHDVADLGFDDRFKRMWDFYLTSCASGFEYGTTDVTQVTIRKPS